MTAVHVVVPDGVYDPRRPSGGNVYDLQACRGLTEIGWTVHKHPVPGQWPRADATTLASLAGVLGGVPDGGLVLLDGLVASAAPEVLIVEADRLRLVVLVHMPLGAGAAGDAVPEMRARERVALSTAAAVITTSQWTRQWLFDRYELPSGRVSVAEPGVELADLAPGTTPGGELLCVGAVKPSKGHDVLFAALTTVADLLWRCVCVGSLDLEPDFVDHLRCRAEESGIADRVCFTGPLTGANLDDAYAGADVLVLASRAETYGMVVTEALARGLPVVATRVGGVPEALGHGADGTRPGLLVPPGNAVAFADALRCWLLDTGQRQRLREAAQERRLTLSSWSRTSLRISSVLAEVTG
jgi:glycosyltransferase involved in cell wall biosynthesis